MQELKQLINDYIDNQQYQTRFEQAYLKGHQSEIDGQIKNKEAGTLNDLSKKRTRILTIYQLIKMIFSYQKIKKTK